MNYLIDTSAWIEYLEGSEKGEKVHSLVNDDKNEIFTFSLIIAELISKMQRKHGNVESAFNAISLCNIISLDSMNSKEAGILHAREKGKNNSFSLANALIIKAAEKNNLKIITTDNHFRSFKEAVLI